MPMIYCTHPNKQRSPAQICVLVVGSYSNRVTTVFRHDGQVTIVGSGPTFGAINTCSVTVKIPVNIHINNPIVMASYVLVQR